MSVGVGDAVAPDRVCRWRRGKITTSRAVDDVLAVRGPIQKLADILNQSTERPRRRGKKSLGRNNYRSDQLALHVSIVPRTPPRFLIARRAILLSSSFSNRLCWDHAAECRNVARRYIFVILPEFGEMCEIFGKIAEFRNR